MGEAATPPGPQAALGADGRYVLVRQIGSGAMGTVHEGHDTVLDRPVAVKLVDRRVTSSPTFRRRFQNEAAILARLDGRSIVRVYDFGTTDDALFLVTQLLPDGDLGTWIREHGPLDPRQAALVVADVCDALDQAHRAGVVHRDVKPGNVLLRLVGDTLEGYLADFGIARPHDSELTTTGEVLGTPSYMAPEQHQGDEASPAGDIYAAGCVLWFCLTGQRPYDGTPHQLALGHIDGPVRQLDLGPNPERSGGSEWPGRLNAVLARAMAKDPDGRYATAAQMAAALRTAAAAAPAGAEPVTPPDAWPAAQPAAYVDPPTLVTAGAASDRRRPGAAAKAASVVLVVLLLALGGWAWWQQSHSDPTARPWRCADRSTAEQRSGCPLPSGAADLTEVFPDAGTCERSLVPVSDRIYAVRCDFEKERGYRLTYSVWPSHEAALAHYRSPEARFSPAGVQPAAWKQEGEDAGLRWRVAGEVRKASFLYADVPYSVSVSAATDRGLQAGIAYILGGAANPPSAFLPRRAD